MTLESESLQNDNIKTDWEAVFKDDMPAVFWRPDNGFRWQDGWSAELNEQPERDRFLVPNDGPGTRYGPLRHPQLLDDLIGLVSGVFQDFELVFREGEAPIPVGAKSSAARNAPDLILRWANSYGWLGTPKTMTLDPHSGKDFSAEPLPMWLRELARFRMILELMTGFGSAPPEAQDAALRHFNEALSDYVRYRLQLRPRGRPPKVSDSVVPVTVPIGPLGAAYVLLVRRITDSERPARRCAYPPCGLTFIPGRRDQIYHEKNCASLDNRRKKRSSGQEAG